MIEIRLDAARLDNLRLGATVVLNESIIYRWTGLGALDCLQGLFTNDVVKPGDDHLLYGAFLTPKGSMVFDAWVLRTPTDLLVLVAAEARDRANEIFKRSLPPRLARVEERSPRWSTCWLFGSMVSDVIEAVEPGALPTEPGAVGRLSSIAESVWIARGTSHAPFEALLVGETPSVEAVRKRAVGANAHLGTSDDFHAARILAGWPALGAEIGDRTLPQEVRFDDIDGVSHTKGCYTGQETVARLHFRGHTNKGIRGLTWSGDAALADDRILRGDAAVGTVCSVLQVEKRGFGLGMIRNVVEMGERVSAGGQEATVVPLPFGPIASRP